MSKSVRGGDVAWVLQPIALCASRSGVPDVSVVTPVCKQHCYKHIREGEDDALGWPPAGSTIHPPKESGVYTARVPTGHGAV